MRNWHFKVENSKQKQMNKKWKILWRIFLEILEIFFRHPKFSSMVEIDIGGADVTFRCQILSKHEKMCQILVANGTHHLYTYQNHVILLPNFGFGSSILIFLV